MGRESTSPTAHAGRYAPSPTGPLHHGSLVAALASFLQARAHGAPWYMRIDDLDTSRVVAGAAAEILRTLERFGLYWDGPVMYQSRRGEAYAEALQRLCANGRLFDCACSRREVRNGAPGLEGPIYPGTCRQGVAPGRTPRSIRIKVDDAPIIITDRVQGLYRQNLATDIGDFVLRRADGIVAYQLATVVDDAAQGVTEVVRGADLLSSTPRQMFLHAELGQPLPNYSHAPLLMDSKGRKLGKSNGALALDASHRSRELVAVLAMLGQAPPLELADAAVDQVMRWAIAHWNIDAVPRRRAAMVTAAGKARDNPGIEQ